MAKPPLHLPLALHSIYVRSSSTSMAEGFHPQMPGFELVPLFRTDHRGRVARNTTTLRRADGADQQARWCAFLTNYQFVYARAKADGTPHEADEIESHQVAKVDAEIAATYSVNAEDFPSEDELGRWGHNVLLHTWPYWREFCHNALMRMGLPVTIIPLINIMPPSAPAQEPRHEES